jgi:hypothetical protein
VGVGSTGRGVWCPLGKWIGVRGLGPIEALQRPAQDVLASREPFELPDGGHGRRLDELPGELAVDAAVDVVRRRPIWRHPVAYQRIRAEIFALAISSSLVANPDGIVPDHGRRNRYLLGHQLDASGQG